MHIPKHQGPRRYHPDFIKEHLLEHDGIYKSLGETPLDFRSETSIKIQALDICYLYDYKQIN